MTPERWAQIEDLFHQAAECSPEQRTALLDLSCSDDPELRREVEALLTCDGSARDNVEAAVRPAIEGFGFPLTGEVVSHYRILEGLGGGGMGLVYRAEDIRLRRLVALKFLPEESANNPMALARFEREARAVSAVEHPNICPIYEFGEHGGRPFLVMQLLEGQTLRELLENRRSEHSKPGVGAVAQRNMALPLVQLLDLAIQIADGLHAAHEKGIIHRDIKPANIFVTKDGHAKILDFGLAKPTRGAPDEGGTKHDAAEAGSTGAARGTATGETGGLFLSRTGVAIGTAGYMSPEQVRGEKLDARTDLFSFGLVLYEMATGERAFAGDTGQALHAAILTQLPVRGRQLCPRLPAKLEQIIHRALQKDLEARYQFASEALADLRAAKRETERKPFTRSWRVFTSAIVLLLVAATFWVTNRQRLSTQTSHDLKLQQLTVNSPENPVTGGAISPDGKYLAYTDLKGMHIELIGTGETQSVPQQEWLTNVSVNWEILPTAWFPDSKRFVANAHSTGDLHVVASAHLSRSASRLGSPRTSIWLVSVSGGALHKLRDNAIASSVSPDGASISFNQGDREIWLMGPNGEQAHKLYEAGDKKAICCLHFFPKLQRVAYISTDESGDTLLARDLESGSVATLLSSSETKKFGDGVWLPDGRMIYSDPCIGLLTRPDTPCNYWIVRLDTHSGGIIEKPTRLTNWVGTWMNGPSVTADNRHVAFLESSGGALSYVGDLEAGGTRVVNPRRFILEEAGEDAIQDWTPDSKAVITSSDRGGHYNLYKQSLNSDTQESIVAPQPGSVEMASVTPDGKWVVAQVTPMPGSPAAQVQLMRIPIAGGPAETILSMRESSTSFCSSPKSNLCAVAEQTVDGKQMVVTGFDPVMGRGRELARFDLNPAVGQNRMRCAISPEGTRLAALAGPEGPIQVRSLGSKRTQVVPVDGSHFLRQLGWAADGKGLIVTHVTDRGSEILHVDLNGKAKVLWKCSTDRCFAQPSPDGRHLAIYDWKLSANIWMMENF